MARILIAAVVANAAGCFLFVLVGLAHIILGDLSRSLGNPGTLLGLTLVVLYLSFGAVCSSTLPASLLFALTGRYCRWRSVWIYLAGGAAIGFSFFQWYWGLSLDFLRKPVFYWIMAFSLASAWLYWLMAREALAEGRKA